MNEPALGVYNTCRGTLILFCFTKNWVQHHTNAAQSGFTIILLKQETNSIKNNNMQTNEKQKADQIFLHTTMHSPTVHKNQIT